MNSNLTFAAALLGLIFLTAMPSGQAETQCGIWREWDFPFFEYKYGCSNDTSIGREYCGEKECIERYFNCDIRRPYRPFSRDIADEEADSKPSLFAGNYTALDLIKFGDTDKDGKLSEIEVHRFATRLGMPDVDKWRALDVNGDNYLTVDEINDNLVPGEYMAFVNGLRISIMLKPILTY